MMNKLLRAFMMCGFAVAAFAATEQPAEKHWSDRLELGTRVTYFMLQDDSSDSFLGSINQLDEKQDYIPYKVFADWMITPAIGVELTWDDIKANAQTDASDEHVDGDFKLTGPVVTVFGRYANQTIFTPFAGAGLSYMFGEFEEAKWWAMGYAHESDWAALGYPDEVRHGISRDIDPDDSIGFVLTGGSDIRITDRLSANLYARYEYIEADTDFVEKRGEVDVVNHDSQTIPFSNFAVGLGVKYSF